MKIQIDMTKSVKETACVEIRIRKNKFEIAKAAQFNLVRD